MKEHAGNVVRVAEAETARPDVSAARSGEQQEPATGRRATRLEHLQGNGSVRSMALPMLDLALDRLPTCLGFRLANSWKKPVRIAGADRASATFDAATGALEGPMLLARFESGSGGGAGVVVIPAQTVSVLISSMLGGAAGPKSGVERVRFSHLDRCLMRTVADHTLQALGESLRPAGDFNFRFVDWVSALEPLRPVVPGVCVIRQGLTLSLADVEAGLEIILPLTMFESALDRLAVPDPGERLGSDTVWRKHLAESVCQASVVIEAVIYEGTAPLGWIRSLNPGDSYSFGLPAQASIRLCAQGRELARGKLGRSGPMGAVQIETPIQIETEGSPA